MQATVMNVAVIGAGPAGLCVAKQLKSVDQHGQIKIDVYEKGRCVGGMWVYEEVSESEDVHSSIYKNMRVNVPKQTMEIPGFPFPEKTPTFMHHSMVKTYFDNFAKHYGLHDVIKLQTVVKKIRPVYSSFTEEKHSKWLVETQDLRTGRTSRRKHDAVVICNGHFSVPRHPHIPGWAYFKGTYLHSHHYRNPASMKGKRVLLLGAGPSGTDLMEELSKWCPKVILSHRGERLSKLSNLPNNVFEKPVVSEIDSRGRLLFADGSSEYVDVFIACTGYDFSFPFLTPECSVEVGDSVVKGLYKHIFLIKNPTLAFVGLPWHTTQIPLLHAQSQYVAAILSGKANLPPEDIMLNDTEAEWKRRQLKRYPSRYFHKMFDEQFEYSNELSRLAHCDENPCIIEAIYRHFWSWRDTRLMDYKDATYVVSDDSFKCIWK